VDIEDVLENGAGFFVKIKGVDTPEAAKPLRGAEFLVNREEAAPLLENEFYIEELKGLKLTDEAGEELGAVNDVIEGGGGFLLEVKLVSGRIVLIPFRNEFLGEISTEKKYVVLLERWILE
jgi:16S rRNA processing protein RimM